MAGSELRPNWGWAVHSTHPSFALHSREDPGMSTAMLEALPPGGEHELPLPEISLPEVLAMPDRVDELTPQVPLAPPGLVAMGAARSLARIDLKSSASCLKPCRLPAGR